MSERRRAIRISVNRELLSFGPAEVVTDVSPGGVFIRTNEVLPVGTEVALKFNVVVDDIETLEAKGNVVRAVEPDDSESPGIAVAFTEVPDATREALQRLSELHGQIGPELSEAPDKPN
jgi:uncharacterized protein (TIGR02266 family)